MIWPPEDESKRAFCGKDDPDVEIRPPDTYLARNREIVKHSILVVGCVDGYEYREHSGTWYTLKHANTTGVNTATVYPDGIVFNQLGHSTWGLEWDGENQNAI